MNKNAMIFSLFVLTLILIGFVTAKLQNFNPFEEGNLYTISFQQVNGLKVDDQVLYSGMHIGHVAAIDARHHDIRVKIVLNLIPDLQLATNSSITIEDRTVLGGKQVSITPPPYPNGIANFGHVFEGETPSDILTDAGKTLSTVSEGFDNIKNLMDGKGTISKLIQEDELQNDAKKVFENLEEISKKLDKIQSPPSVRQ